MLRPADAGRGAGIRWRVAATITVLLAIFVWSSRVSVFRINQDVFDDSLATALNDAPVQQTFLSNYPGLNAVTLQLVEPYPPGDQPVTLRLVDAAPDARVRLALSGPLSQFRVGGELHFTFQPLDDSTARQYRLVLTTQGTYPLLLRADRLDMYPAGGLSGGGDLMFQVRYNGFLVPSVVALLPQLAENKPGLLGQPWFYVLLGLLYVAVLFGALTGLARRLELHTAEPLPQPGPDQLPDPQPQPGALPSR